MKGSRLMRLLVCLGLTAAMLTGGVVSACPGGTEHTKMSKPDKHKIFVFSDPHYYSTELGVGGQAFMAYLAQDRKLLVESDAILRKTVESIKQSDAAIVLVPGDLTKDGEMLNHVKVAGYLKEIEDSGKKVYVIDGNHDINNPQAFRYDGSQVTPVANVTPEQFKAIYHDFGYGEAIATDPGSLSYVVEPEKNMRIIVMDSASYATNLGAGHSEIAGAFSAGTLSWIEQQTKAAKAKGKVIFGVMHHGLVEHFTGQSQLFGDYVIADSDQVASTLAEAGMEVVLSGHFHAQDITARQVGDSKIYDIETGSLLSYPNPYRIIEVTADNKLNVTSAWIDEIEFDTSGVPFQEYSRSFLVEGLNQLAPYMLADLLVKQGLDQQEAFNQATAALAKQISATTTVKDVLVQGMLANYQGDEVLDQQLIPVLQGLAASPNPLEKMLGSALLSLNTDLAPADNDVELRLKKNP